MVANIRFATIKYPIDAEKFLNTIQLSPKYNYMIYNSSVKFQLIFHLNSWYAILIDIQR
jgi:hypothetical protein